MCNDITPIFIYYLQVPQKLQHFQSPRKKKQTSRQSPRKHIVLKDIDYLLPFCPPIWLRWDNLNPFIFSLNSFIVLTRTKFMVLHGPRSAWWVPSWFPLQFLLKGYFRVYVLGTPTDMSSTKLK